MSYLHEILAEKVNAWRASEYQCDEYPAITELLEYQIEELTNGSGIRTLRHLREPQLKALETYWYLRLIEGTPHIFELYKKYISKQTERLQALGIDMDSEYIRSIVVDEGVEPLWDKVRFDDEFVRSFKLESLRETLTLDYPSYILALAMGAGKTQLIGAIIATEFAMALEYPSAEFVRNALVFAPGKTILESLRELTATPYERILPPRHYKQFAATVKMTFTRDGEKGIPVIQGSVYNIVVTNTEKIRIQKESVSKLQLGSLGFGKEDDAKQEVANLRLQAIASLPNLAIFSDEAHHTYGQSLLGSWQIDKETGERIFKEAGIKKVRKTVDYLAAQTNLICVVNTTGTPYFQRQPLKDVVVWYGLSQGIKDDILKELSGNIKAYEFEGDVRKYVQHVIEDFFRDYGSVHLPAGHPAKLAMYFPQTEDLEDLKPVVAKKLLALGYDPGLILVNTSDEKLTTQADIDAFNRLNEPQAPHRVILLVNKGTEGWNCPSLFACALVRKLKSSNNFVLQASTRCLRQVPGNSHSARVYLSMDNEAILDRQLQETYGESIQDLNQAGQESLKARIVLRKLTIPPLCLTQEVRTVQRSLDAADELKLSKPQQTVSGLREVVYKLAQVAGEARVLEQAGVQSIGDAEADGLDCYTAAAELAAQYRLNCWLLYSELKRLYGEDEVPAAHLGPLARQIEEQTRKYEYRTELRDFALALVKPEGFQTVVQPNGEVVYTAEIMYPKDREKLLLSLAEFGEAAAGGFGFHYDPYNFDSSPELDYFRKLLAHITGHPDLVEDIYFTGALTSRDKTEFFVEYKDEKGKWRKYTPDFIIRSRRPPEQAGLPDRVYIVEIKKEHDREHPIDGEHGRKAMAIRQWEQLNPDKLKYEIIFTSTDAVPFDALSASREFVEGKHG